MKNLSKIYALSEFIPEISSILQYGNEAIIAKEIAEIAAKITNTENTMETIKALKEPEKLELFKSELLKFAINFKKIPSEHKVNPTAIITIITLSLLTCISFIILGRDKIPSDAIPILSAISGIFGSCLKDAFSSIFGIKHIDTANIK